MNNDFRLSSYSSVKVLKKSRYGEVELAWHKELKCRRIIKTVYRLHPQYDKLTCEARTLQKLKNENIPIVYDVFENNAGMTFIEEFIEGETLTRHLRIKMHLSMSELLDYSVKLSEILIFLHEPYHKVFHLDIKPDNLIISDNKMKLIDFGSAICQIEEKEEQIVLGTKEFAAPEQTGDGLINESTDIYALGKTLEYMLMYAPIVPKGYEQVVKNCLRKGKVLYTSAEEVRNALLKLKGKTGKHAGIKWIVVTGIPTDFHGSRFAYELAKHIKSLSGKKVILLDCNRACNLETLEKTKKDTDPQNFVFEKDKVTVAKRVLTQEVKSWRSYGGDYIICDFGNTSPDESGIPFDYHIAVGSGQPWNGKNWSDVLSDCRSAVETIVVITDGRAYFRLPRNIKAYECISCKAFKKVTRCISQLIVKQSDKKALRE